MIDDVEGEFRELFDRLLARVGLRDFETLLGQALGERFAQRGLILDEQQMFLGLSHLGSVNTLTWKVKSGKLKVKSGVVAPTS